MGLAGASSATENAADPAGPVPGLESIGHPAALWSIRSGV